MATPGPPSRDVAAGAVFVALGGYVAVYALARLRIGEALQMGPGYFPLVLGLILAALGLVIALNGLRAAPQSIGHIPWRGILLVIGSILFFSFAVRRLGFAPAILVAALMSARAGGLGWRGSVLLAVLLCVFSILAFIVALGLRYPVLGPWLSV